MPRKFTEEKLVIASHNPGKVIEINELLGNFGVEAISAGALGLPEPIEDGLTFIANAEIKARANTDFPVPNSPSNAKTSPSSASPASFSAKAAVWVSSAKFNRAMLFIP